VNLTEGLGAGANPDVGQQSAESIAETKDVGSKYQDGFITAGMGGGTGTVVRPVIAQPKKEKFLL
jgi:cell division protein FtsZ